MVFETDQCAGRDVLDLYIDDDVADEPFLAGFRSDVDEPDAGEALALGRLVVVAEELVAPADGEHSCTCLDRSFQWRLLVLEQVFVHERLLAVLPPAEEENVHVLHVLGGAAAELHESCVVVPPLRTLEQGDDVAPVAIDVHEVGVEPADGEGLLAARHAVATF